MTTSSKKEVRNDLARMSCIIMPRVCHWKTWIVKLSRSCTVTRTWRLFGTSQYRTGNDEENKDGQNDSPASEQLERTTIRKKNENLTDKQKEHIRQLHRSGLSITRIQRESFPEFSRAALFAHLEPTRGSKWTQEEDDTLLELRHKGMKTEDIKASVFPQYSARALEYRITRLQARNPGAQNDLRMRKPFTAEKVEQLKQLHAQGRTIAEIANLISRSQTAVGTRIRSLNLGTIINSDSKSAARKKWTQAEDDLLKPYLAVRFAPRHFAALDQLPTWRRTFRSAEGRLGLLRRKAGIVRDWRKWSSVEAESARRFRAEGLTTAQIAEKLGRNSKQVWAKIYSMEKVP